jgi:hypothetical protein
MNPNHNPPLIRLEAVGISPQEANNVVLTKKRLIKLSIGFIITVLTSALVSYLTSLFPNAEGLFKIVLSLVNLIAIGLFIFAGISLFIFLAINRKDYSGGYIEVYSDCVVIMQRSHFSNDDRWESASIWYRDILRMWNTSDKSNSRILRENQEVERYTDGVCFEYISGHQSHSISVANLGGRPGATIFRLNCKGYAKTAILDVAKTIHSAAQVSNPKLEYQIL